jgi:hypothetical protein
MRRLRTTTGRAIALLLASIVCAGASVGHSAWDDPWCDPVPVHHDHNAHRFQSGRLPAPSGDEHCLACHSLRSLRSGLIAVGVVVTTSTNVAPIRTADVVLSGRFLDSGAPSRAPPVDLL